MDEELGVKVTRLRRRLSVEAEGTQSPATPSTPTKKRATRLAKPALELINENATENVPKRATRKSIARDVAEPVEEKAVTPSRRSARIRSNTSLILETTHNVVDSPRAKRATRRNSQLGSDTETATTPARQSRRTRKESTDSVEQLGLTNTNEKLPALVTGVILEEPEKEITKDSEVDRIDNQSPPLRKSPRLNKKGRKSIDEAVKDINQKQNGKALSETTKLTDETSSRNGQAITEEVSSNAYDETDNKFEPKDAKQENISITSAKLINEIDSNPKMSSVFNKSTSAIEEIKDDKNNRKRTKSWTTITNDLSTEKDNNHVNLGSGDNLMKNNEKTCIRSPNRSLSKSALAFNISLENKENINYLKTVALDAGDTVKLLGKAPGKDIQSMVFIEDSDSNSGSSGKLTIDLQNNRGSQYNDGEDQCVPVVQQPTPKKSTSESFTVEPMDIDETIPENVTINDFSDKTNSSREENELLGFKQESMANENSTDVNKSSNKSIRTISLQQESESNNSKRKSSISAYVENSFSKGALNKSDRSLSDKQHRTPLILQNEDSERANEKTNKSKRKSSLSKVEVSVKINETSKRKSVSETESQSLEKTSNENKSTLVLSQLKDVSANEISNVSKSSNDTNNELSKSVNVPAKETDNKLLSLHYSTSTPLQQKPLQKIAMQINTSIISPNAESKNPTKVSKTTPKKRVSDVCQDSDDDSDEDPKVKSKLIDDEAEEASSNYESGDSRSDAERQYEDNHEIVEKGETLESEQELSDDSDYEKDSFIVSSDEDDNDLLSGSGDDLALSDNELKMTSKSKKKFDERKRKEQIKASKEMYESRHKLNESDKSSKSKAGKSKRQRLESSLLESEQEDLPQFNKKHRRRIDSSQDMSPNNSDVDESICVKKKKVKRLSVSVCEENTDHNEKEITICNQSTTEKNDPLSIVVKQEPKTPQKKLNMSTVVITDDIEEVQVDTNASIMNPNETSDPLQTTLAPEDVESDSDISENMEIKENYDSVLENLNKSNNKQKKFKKVDTSLNLNKMTKDKVKEPIVDQLNLTETKKSKKSKAQAVEKHEITKEQQTVKHKVSVPSDKNDDGDVSDSIDMRLLFPEDSNDSDANASKFKTEEKQSVEPAEEFIPLKRTGAKTNIRESMDLNLSNKNESEPNESKKKNKKRKSSQCIPESAIPEESEEGAHVSFFIDTKGTYDDMDPSTQNSTKKNKKKHKHSLSMENGQNDMESKETLAEIGVAEETSFNVSLKSDKKKKKNKSFDISETNDNTEPIDIPVNVIMDSDKKKKKRNKSFNDSQDIKTAPLETSENVSLNLDKKNKKKNKSFNISQNVDNTESIDIPENVTLNSDKKKNKTIDDILINDNTAPIETPVNVSLDYNKKKKKKNKSFDITETVDNTEPIEIPVNVSQNSEKKKKNKNKSFDISEVVDKTEPIEIPVNVSHNSEKKKKKKNKSFDISDVVGQTEPIEIPVNVSQNSEKKKKKKNKSFDISDVVDQTEPIEIPVNVSQNSDKKKKKKNKSLDVSQAVDNTGEESDEAPLEVSYKSEKKSDNVDPVPDDVDAVVDNKNKYKKKKKKNKNKTQPQEDKNTVNIEEGEVSSKKRKRDATSAPSIDAADDEIKLSKNQKKKRRKLSQNDDKSANVLSEEVLKNKPKKRKATEIDDGQQKTKMFKENSFDKIHVPRLPESIVNQLDDKPQKELNKQKKKKAISTVPFAVEEAKKRKNKPSNYLEQSIYLNDTPVKQKQKAHKSMPKVLPSIPTVITSGKGYTSKFQINVLPQETEFVAQASDMPNFKNEFLSKQRIKKLGTFERFKKQRNHKISKF